MSKFSKVAHDDGWATQLWFVTAADEPGADGLQPPATQIVCERMYEWAADWMLDVLEGQAFPDGPSR
jgi:hypothetical protein